MSLEGNANTDPIKSAENAKNILTDDQIDDFKQTFALFKEEDGFIKSKDLRILMRCLGQSVSDEELKEMINEVDEKKVGKIGFPEFLMLIARKMQHMDEEEELREAFKIFNRDKERFISTAELRYVMKTFGEKLSKEDVEDMIKSADPHNKGELNYYEFVEMLMRN